jgi:hypothetical protein
MKNDERISSYPFLFSLFPLPFYIIASLKRRMDEKK